MSEETTTGRTIRLIQEEAAAKERDRCVKIAEAYAETCRRGSSMSSMAEDMWGAVVGDEIAKLIRRGHKP